VSEAAERYGDAEPRTYAAFLLPVSLVGGLAAEAARSRQTRSAIAAQAIAAELARRATARERRDQTK
jgi:hypothetical protein